MLARELGAWQSISWALVLVAPLMIVLVVVSIALQPPAASPVEWLSFAYLGVVSMYLAFFAWYRGLAIGPMASVSQVQLIQPVLSIAWAVLLLHEGLTWLTVIGGLAVILFAGLAVRVRLTRVAAVELSAQPSGTSCTARTSMRLRSAFAARVAQSTAAASSAASITQNPPTYSSACTNGPFSTTISSPVPSIVFALDGGWSPAE